MKYDPNAMGLLPVDLFENLVTDLIFEELKYIKSKDQNESDQTKNAFFNLRFKRNLLLLTKLSFSLDSDLPYMKEIKH
jgi:hypothetical protein